MSGLSVLTLVRNREAHLHQLVEGLKRSSLRPTELIVVDMSDEPVAVRHVDFPVRVERLDGAELPLAAARNRAAALAGGDLLMFLDVDCIPMRACLARMAEELDRVDGLLCADVRYLGPSDARGSWTEHDLVAKGRRHPARQFPQKGTRVEANPGLFWSLAFAIRAERFAALGGFDERYAGYGAEDTDFGFHSAETGTPLIFVGGAIACHQHHESHEPPVQHVRDIVRNATVFHEKWGRWPMEGWLAALARLGLVTWSRDQLTFVRPPTPAEMRATSVDWLEDPARPSRTDRSSLPGVPAA